MSPRIVHVTHEAVRKIGGIGTVLEGLITSQKYREGIERTILLGPFDKTASTPEARLGPGGQIHYSSMDEILGGPHPEAFQSIEAHYGVRLVHGDRVFLDPQSGREISVEVVLVDVGEAYGPPLRAFKAELWKAFGLQSDHYESIGEYELYLRMAEPGYDAVRLLLGPGGLNIFIAHDFMGMATVLKVALMGDPSCKTVFHAHEAATARMLVEQSPGHDTMFYNVMRAASYQGRSLDGVFGQQDFYFKHPLVRLACHCDAIFAVGDLVREELRFLGSEFQHRTIDCVYNGVPVAPESLERRQQSRSLLKNYAEALFGFRPDYVLTHVARPVTSKALWRDLQVLFQMDSHLKKRGRRAAYFLLASEGSARRDRQDVLKMEQEYNWPVFHRHGWPDLQGEEVHLNDRIQLFNLAAKNVAAAFVNQFGWDRASCGDRMPETMTFADLRRGTDAEFGLSIYEPFGIAPLEPLTFGATCVISNVSGCRGFLDAVQGLNPPLVLVGDYTFLDNAQGDPEQLLRIGRRVRDQIEIGTSKRLAQALADNLTDDPQELTRRLDDGLALASKMDWDTVVRDQFLPGLPVD